eukprot:scaffold86760_cov20-Tisochrysis_lutea.AAC.1
MRGELCFVVAIHLLNANSGVWCLYGAGNKLHFGARKGASQVWDVPNGLVFGQRQALLASVIYGALDMYDASKYTAAMVATGAINAHVSPVSLLWHHQVSVEFSKCPCNAYIMMDAWNPHAQ